MASSNRHWPSMFKSKPCNNNQSWPNHHDLGHHHPSSLLSNSCGRASSTASPFSSGCEERSPEPKPRWNPKPEQIRILEAIFNSGMVNPPRDEIRRIRAQLQEYGQVGDANVFYWFQNRKSRSKHKQRAAAKNSATASTTASSSSSTSNSSDKASPKKPRNNNNGSSNNNNVVVEQFGVNSPTSVNQCNNNNSYFHQLIGPPQDFVAAQESIYFPLQQSGATAVGPYFGVGNDSISGGDGVGGGGFSTLLLGEMIGGGSEGKRDEVEKIKFQQELSFLVSSGTTTSSACTTLATPTSGSLGQVLGLGDGGGVTEKSTVFVDNMAIEVPVGPLNVKEAFGEDALLVHPTGHPVLTNEWGVTLHPLQNGSFYYLVRTVAASPLLDKLETTPDLLAHEFTYQI